MNDLQTILEKWGYDILKDDKKLDEFLSNLSIDDFKKYLIFLNSQVRRYSGRRRWIS